MKKVIKKRNNKLASVYAWAVDYSKAKAKERKSGVRTKGPEKAKPALK